MTFRYTFAAIESAAAEGDHRCCQQNEDVVIVRALAFNHDIRLVPSVMKG